MKERKVKRISAVKEIGRRTFLKEGLKQLGAIVGIGIAVKSLRDSQEQKESLAQTDTVLNHNAEVGNQTNSIVYDHEMRLRQLEGKFNPPQKANGVRKI